MTVAADTYLPAVWSLDTSTVQGIESSRTDPKVRLDSTGLFTTDDTGGQIVKIAATPTGGTKGGIDLAGAPSGDPQNNARIRFVRPTDGFSSFQGALQAELYGSNDAGGFGIGQLLAHAKNMQATFERNALILDSNGKSNFAQTGATARKSAIFGGQATATFSGGTTSNILTITHQLGMQANGVVFGIHAASLITAYTISGTVGPTTFQCQLASTNGSVFSFAVDFFWLAFAFV